MVPPALPKKHIRHQHDRWENSVFIKREENTWKWWGKVSLTSINLWSRSQQQSGPHTLGQTLEHTQGIRDKSPKKKKKHKTKHQFKFKSGLKQLWLCVLTKHVESSDGVGLQCFNWIVHVVGRRGWRCQVVDLVHCQKKKHRNKTLQLTYIYRFYL